MNNTNEEILHVQWNLDFKVCFVPLFHFTQAETFTFEDLVCCGSVDIPVLSDGEGMQILASEHVMASAGRPVPGHKQGASPVEGNLVSNSNQQVEETQGTRADLLAGTSSKAPGFS